LRPAREALGFAGRLAIDRLVRIPDQLALAAAVLALGLGLMMTAATVARSFEESVLDFIRRQVRADLVFASTATTGWLEAPVAGVVVDYVSPRGSVILARPTYQRWWGDRSVNRFHVTLAPGASLEAVRHAIATDVGADLGLRVLTQRELYAYHRDAVRRAFRLTDALEILPLVVAALG